MNALHVRLVLFGLADGFRVALSILRDNRLRYSYVSKKSGQTTIYYIAKQPINGQGSLVSMLSYCVRCYLFYI